MYIGKYIVSPLVFSLFLGNSGAGELVLLVDPRFHKLVYFVWYFSVFSQNGWIQLDKLLALSFHIWWRRSFQSLGSSDYQFIVDLSNLPFRCHVVNFGGISLKIFTSSGLFCSTAKLPLHPEVSWATAVTWIGFHGQSWRLAWTGRVNSLYRLLLWGFHTTFASQGWALNMSHHCCSWEYGMVQ